MPRLSKRNKTYRQDSDIIELIERAARETGLSEAELVDACILAQIGPVLRRLVIQRAALKHKAVQTALTQFAKSLPPKR